MEREQRKRTSSEKVFLGSFLMLFLIVSTRIEFEIVHSDPSIDAFLVDFSRVDRERRGKRADFSAADRRIDGSA